MKICQLIIKEYLCWVSFWFVTFPWEKTKFNATFILTHQCTLCGTIFLLLLRKRSLHFTALSGTNSHWTNMKFCSLLEQILLFNPAFEIAWNSQQNERYDVLKFALFSSAKFTPIMSIKSFISYAIVFITPFSFKLYSWNVLMTFVTAGPLV